MTIRPAPDARPAQPVADLAAYDAPPAELTKVADGECLYCYLTRMLDAFGCRTGDHQFTKQWIHSQQGKHGWVLNWVKKNGGCCCDCEVILNTFRDDRYSQRHQQLRCATSYLEADDNDDNDNEDDEDDDPSDYE
jgi:hypothetical protein